MSGSHSSFAFVVINLCSGTVAFMAAVILYLSVVVPGVKTIANPQKIETEAERIESLRVIGAANTMMIVCLAAVLLMQVSQLVHVQHPYEANSSDIIIFSRLDKSTHGATSSESLPSFKLQRDKRGHLRRRSSRFCLLYCHLDFLLCIYDLERPPTSCVSSLGRSPRMEGPGGG